MNKDLFKSSNEKRIVEIKNNVYQNNLFNISFQIPKSWHVVQVEDFNKLATKQKFKESAEFLKDYVFETIGSPCLVTTKL